MTRTRFRWRFWWLLVALLVLLPLGVAAIAAATFDAGALKVRLATIVQAQTGRALTLNGPLRIGWSLWPTLEVNDVKLANLPGGSRPDMARAERIRAQISLPALLLHRLELVRLTLVGPNILFEQVDGQPNWVFRTPVSTKPAAVPGKQSPTAPAGSTMTLQFRDVVVQNGMLTFHFPARTKVVGVRSLAFRHTVDGGPLTLSTVLVYSDNQPFALKVAAAPTGGIDDPWKTRLDFAAFDATATASGTMDLAGSYDLEASANLPALEKLNALLPEMQLPPLHGMTVTTHIRNGPARGDLPVIGRSVLHVGSADLQALVPGLVLGAVAASLPAEGGLATLDGGGRLHGQGFTLGGTIGIPAHPDGRVGVPLDLTAAMPGAASRTVGIKGRLALDALQFAGLDGALSVRTPDLAGLPGVAAGQMLPPLTDVALDGRLVVPASLGEIGLRDATLKARQAQLSGSVTMGLGKAGVITAVVHGARLDLDALLPADTAAGAGSPAAPKATATPATGPVIPSSPLPLAMLRGPSIELQAGIDAITWQRTAWRDAALVLHLQGGRLRIERLHAMLPGGAVDGSLSADASNAAVPVSLSLQAAGIPLALLARSAELPGAVDGAVHLAADLHATGASPHALAASLDGSLAVTMLGGRISNAALQKVASASLTALGIKVPADGETAIRCLGLTGTFQHGAGRFDTIAVDTTYLQLIGDGKVDLGAETIDLKLHPLARLAGSSVVVPVVVTGPFRDIKGRLDASGLDKVGLLVDALFGGDHPKTCRTAGLLPAPPATAPAAVSR